MNDVPELTKGQKAFRNYAMLVSSILYIEMLWRLYWVIVG